MLTQPGLKELDYIPPGLLHVEARDLHTILPEPTLIHLSGRIDQPLFISLLLHGNEITGLLVIQALLKKYAHRELPRSLSIFFGNIEAAREGLRRLDGQADFNRVWPGTTHADCAEKETARQVVEIMASHDIFASIDIHNNTGINPHYACVNKLKPCFLRLASLFAQLVVYFITPKGVQSAAFAELCPAVTLECGKPGELFGVEHARDFVDSVLHLRGIANDPVANREIDLFNTVARVSIKEQKTFGFQQDSVDLSLNSNLDHMNFAELTAGTILGVHKPAVGLPIIARDAGGSDVTLDYFEAIDDKIVFKKPIMPSMLTLDECVIRQDCLCYLMKRITV